MERIDTRKLSQEALQQLRHQAIRLRKKGKTYKEISEVIDVHYSTICGWWKTYEKEGQKVSVSKHEVERKETTEPSVRSRKRNSKKLLKTRSRIN